MSTTVILGSVLLFEGSECKGCTITEMLVGYLIVFLLSVCLILYFDYLSNKPYKPVTPPKPRLPKYDYSIRGSISPILIVSSMIGVLVYVSL